MTKNNCGLLIEENRKYTIFLTYETISVVAMDTTNNWTNYDFKKKDKKVRRLLVL
jgi:hypothetical protein